MYELEDLRHIPKCWAIVQSFVCSLFLPNCYNDLVDLPSQETCRLVLGPCRTVLNHTIWPNFIKCEDTKLFPPGCRNDHRDVKFNNSGKCLEPLIPTDNPLALFEGIDGCGLPCSDPLYSNDEQKQIHSFIAWAAGICFLFNFFTVVSLNLIRSTFNTSEFSICFLLFIAYLSGGLEECKQVPGTCYFLYKLLFYGILYRMACTIYSRK